MPWQILAAINEIETDYGTDQSVSTAGAVGWMQFMPATWLSYGVDAFNAGYADPYNPVDAIFAAARYLRAAGRPENLRGAILAYNHSEEYADSVLLRAKLISTYPQSVVATLTSLVDDRLPVSGKEPRSGSLKSAALPPPSSTAANAIPFSGPPANGPSTAPDVGATGATGATGASTGPGAAAQPQAPSPTSGSTPLSPEAVAAAATGKRSGTNTSQLLELLRRPTPPWWRCRTAASSSSGARTRSAST